MSQRHKLSRREWLKGAAALSGAAVGTRLAGSGFEGTAHADTPKAAVVSIFLEGGLNACFGSADSFTGAGSFGVSDAKIRDLGNGLKVDKATFGSLDAWSLGHMATIGNRHGLIDHPGAQRNNFLGDNRSFPVMLAAAMGGNAAFKAAAMGALPPGGAGSSEGGVSLQLIRTMGDVSTALGLGAINHNRPARNLAAKGLDRSRTMSQASILKNAQSMRSADDAYLTNISSLALPVLSIDVDGICKAYGVSSGGNLDSVPAKLAAAELMIRGGTNVITLSDTASGWDTHGDSTGTACRNKMAAIMPALTTFYARLTSEPALAAMNISVMVHGEFARSLPTSDHAPVVTPIVVGRNVKVGTTGHVSAAVALPEGTGASKEMWSYLAELAKVPKNPFPQNPHQLVL